MSISILYALLQLGNIIYTFIHITHPSSQIFQPFTHALVSTNKNMQALNQHFHPYPQTFQVTFANVSTSSTSVSTHLAIASIYPTIISIHFTVASTYPTSVSTHLTIASIYPTSISIHFKFISTYLTSVSIYPTNISTCTTISATRRTGIANYPTKDSAYLTTSLSYSQRIFCKFKHLVSRRMSYLLFLLVNRI